MECEKSSLKRSTLTKEVGFVKIIKLKSAGTESSHSMTESLL